MRADRLVSIILLLQNRGKLTTRELAQMLEVSERTIFRDMEALSAAGIPVLAERGRDGGWMLSEGYRTSLTGMKAKEIASLLLSADTTILRDLGIQEDFFSAARKLEAISGPSPGSPVVDSIQRIYVDSESWHPVNEAYPYLGLLQEALWQDRAVHITYLRGETEKARLIHPLGLVNKRGVWYVIAETDNELRTFRVSRIQAAELTPYFFTRPEGFDLGQYWQKSTQAFKAAIPSYPIKLMVREDIMNEFCRERYVTVTHTSSASGSGWLLVEAELNTLEWACRVLLCFGSGVVALSPQELLDKVQKELSGASALYRTLIPEENPKT